jgi:hypothetical protein
VDAGTEARIERAIDESFVAGFRAAMLVSAGLALASALAAALLVGDSGRHAKRVLYSGDPGVDLPVLHDTPQKETTRKRQSPQPVTIDAP